MDYPTARNLILNQGLVSRQHPDMLLARLQQSQPPIPGQVTSILLALKVLFDSLQDASELDRELAAALHILASESRQHFERGRKMSVVWPPLLDEDLTRITLAVKSIFLGSWQS